MKDGLTQKGTPFKQNTKHDWIRVLRQFLLWMIENEYSDLPEKKVRRIKIPSVDHMTKKASDLLSPEEVKAILSACRKSVDRAMIGMLYEGGFRIVEIASMKWGDLRFDSSGIVVNVNFKTGKPRYVRIIMAREYVAQWRADYPGVPEGEALVFINTLKRPLNNVTVIANIDRICKRAGIPRHVTPHIFRHSRITHLINEGVSESVIKMIMWGSVHTNMFKAYAHLTGENIDDELKRLYHIDEGSEKKRFPRVEPQICPHCNSIMPPVSKYCSFCGQSLDLSQIAPGDNIQKFVCDHPKETKEYIDNRRKAPLLR
jgi:site-specific recombinase XerD